MVIPTSYKLSFARLIYRCVIGFRRAFGRGPDVVVKRGGIRWSLDLREAIDLYIYLRGRFEPETIAAEQRLVREGDTVADIGANMGAHTLWLARFVGPRGKVLAFEPTVATLQRLKRNIELNTDLRPRIDARQVMLVAAPGAALETQIYASWRADIRPPADAHPLHQGVPVSTAGASTVTFDQSVANAGRIALIKLDVDGHELDVLKGAQATLARDHPLIVMEFAPYTLRERGQDPDELIRLLSGLDYRFFDLSGRPVLLASADEKSQRAGASINVLAAASDNPFKHTP